MPDRDIFSQHVEQVWQSNARRVLRGDPSDREVGLVLRALGREVRSAGCPHLHEISELISNLSQPIVWDMEAEIQLFDIASTGNHQHTELALRGARRLVTQAFELSDLRIREGGTTTSSIRYKLAEEYLLDLVRSKTVVPCLLQSRVAKYGLAYEDQITQADRSMEQIRVHPKFQTMVDELARDPSGALISLPMNVEHETDQDELLAMSVAME